MLNPRCPSCLFRVKCLIAPYQICVADQIGTLSLTRVFIRHYLTQPVRAGYLAEVVMRFLQFWGREVDYRRAYNYLITLEHSGLIRFVKGEGFTIVEPVE